MDNEAKRKRRHGPEPLPPDQKRTYCVSVRLNAAELAMLDSKRAQLQRGEWLRVAALDKLPPSPAPSINVEAWADLGKSLGNLATIGVAMRGGEYMEIDEIRAIIKELRPKLLGLSREVGGEE